LPSGSRNFEIRTINSRIAPWFGMTYDDQVVRKSEKYGHVIRPIIPSGSPPLQVFPAP
jgi:hypothetical protein